MKTIHKFPFAITDRMQIGFPQGARILAFQNQNEQPVLWALVNVEPEQTWELREFHVFGTGHPIENLDKLIYVGTAQFSEGRLVWHLFEVVKS